MKTVRILRPAVGAALLAALLMLAGVTTVSAAPLPVQQGTVLTTFDSQMVTLINQARAANRLPAVTATAGLRSVSLSWSSAMDAGSTGYQLKHNPNAWTQVATNGGASNRTLWGENVGWSSSNSTTAKAMFDAYMASPGHRANILGSGYRYIGVGTVAGSHGLWNTMEFTDKVLVVAAASTPAPVKLKDGDFVRDAASGGIFRIAGGAPVYVSSWTPVGGAKPYYPLTAAQFAALPKYPRDGTFVRTLSPAQVFRFAGGAPQYVYSWAPFGGTKPTITIDPAAIRNAGLSGTWSHVAKYPVDNTYIRAADTNKVYRMLGGVATFLYSWSTVGGVKPTTIVDGIVIRRAGGAAPFDHLRAVR